MCSDSFLVQDMTPFVDSQRAAGRAGDYEQLEVPVERLYPTPPALVQSLRISEDVSVHANEEEENDTLMQTRTSCD